MLRFSKGYPLGGPPPVFMKFQPNFMESMVITWEYRQFSWWSAKFKKKKYGTLKFFLTQDHMALEISKYYTYSFHWISAKLYEDFGDCAGIQAVTSLGSLKFCGTWNLEISKYYCYSVHLIPAKLNKDIAYRGGYNLLLFLEISKLLKTMWHLEILTREPVGKS